MKKTGARRLDLHRETLRQLTSGHLKAARGQKRDEIEDSTGCSVPSCIDGCPTVFTC